MKCPKCKEALREDDVFCTRCGNKIEGQLQQPQIAQSSAGKTPVIIASIAVIAIFVGICLWLNRGSETEKMAEEQMSDVDIQEDTAEKQIEKVQPEQNKEVQPEQNKEVTKKNTKNSPYIFAESGSRYLSEKDVNGKTLQEINYGKNEIYARHGRLFQSNELQSYFNSQPWYNGKYDGATFDATYGDSVMNDYEKRNAEYLSEVEFSVDSKGYQLDAR